MLTHDPGNPDRISGRVRSAGDFEVVAGALVGVHGEGDRGPVRDQVRAMVAFYGSTPAYRPVLDSIGAGALQPELQDLTRDGRWGDLAAVVDDRVLDELAVVGTADDVARRLRARYHGRVDRLSLTFVQPLPPLGLGELVDGLAG